MRDHCHNHHHSARHTSSRPHCHSAEFYPSRLHAHHFPSRGLHWVGLAALATTFIRKGKGEPVFWFGLGALVASIIMKHRASVENAWWHRCRSGKLGTMDGKRKRGVNWRLTVVGDDADEEEIEHDGSRAEDTCQVHASPNDRDVCSCSHTEAEAEETARVETLFDAANDIAVGGRDDPLSLPSNEPRAADARALRPPTLQATTLESRIDSLARAVEEIRLHINQLGEVPGSRSSSTVSSGYDVGAAFADGAQPNS